MSFSERGVAVFSWTKLLVTKAGCSSSATLRRINEEAVEEEQDAPVEEYDLAPADPNDIAALQADGGAPLEAVGAPAEPLEADRIAQVNQGLEELMEYVEEEVLPIKEVLLKILNKLP